MDDLKQAGPSFDYRLALVIYVRVLALIFIASGLARWGAILAGPADGGDFLSQPTPLVIATIFFAVANLVAAVGLWLLASWGTVVWMIAAITDIALHLSFVGVFGDNNLVIVFHLFTVAVYAILTFFYERTRDLI